MKPARVKGSRRADRARELVEEVASYVRLHHNFPGWSDVTERRSISQVVEGARTVREGINRVASEIGGMR